MKATSRSVLVAAPRGFCAGVRYAVDIVERVLERYGAPVYVRHEIVHNRRVCDGLRARGVVFVEDPAEVPSGAVLVFSAHGVSPAVREAASDRRLRVIDATCPLVAKVHAEVLRYAGEGYEILLIGHRGHVEVEGTLGHAPEVTQVVEDEDQAERVSVRDPERVAAVTQTTLSVDDTREILAVLQRRFPRLRTPNKDDICYATQNRQAAVKGLTAKVALTLVIGSRNSSNANRLVEAGSRDGGRARLIESEEDIDAAWLADVEVVGLTAAASTPESLVGDVLARLEQFGYSEVSELESARENLVFPLPKALRAATADA